MSKCAKKTDKVLKIRFKLLRAFDPVYIHQEQYLQFMASSVHREAISEKWNPMWTSQLEYNIGYFTITDSSLKAA